ncbi:hypothetical protein BV25DRAFT_1046609 [Artomyces pyxidatus]|uniref:Uncharacterized protein n=1 Tax=Artomyces pyxidatus TaxID=48021 RepID=A0ACB8SUE1_9AGAM|nr:hypothetical protein BV25DRAFT_1046609 [Artomyces pyxidatus]
MQKVELPSELRQQGQHGFRPLDVGIVGGGMAGLYAALLLQRAGHRVRIFEGTDRVGGRVRTHHFSEESNQYFEAGAMRIPESVFHTITFNLIKFLQYIRPALPADKKVRLIPYIISAPGNRLYVNGHREDGYHASSTTPADIGWPVPEKYKTDKAEDLMWKAIGTFITDLEDNFDKGFQKLLQFDNYSFRFYLTSVMGWPDTVVDFVETVISQSNQFALSVTEMVMQYMDFKTKNWWTIDHGMNRLPYAMAYLVGYKNITYGARVTGLSQSPGKVTISAFGYNGALKATFDKVIMAIPPAAMRMIADRPRWDPLKELAIRTMHFEPLYKMGMRFKTRFWERVQPKSTRGGQSTTDLPIRWIVYPSNGMGTSGPGVLLIYAWMTDANTWLPLTPTERRSLALHCIAELYQGERDVDGSKIDVYDLLMGTSDAIWSTRTATGDAMFLPGQFEARFEIARRPEKNIFFAGEHLSYHHTWISGALWSALYTVGQVLGIPNVPQLAYRNPFKNIDEVPDDTIHAEPPSEQHGWIPPLILGSRDGDGAVPRVEFEFKPKDSMFGDSNRSRWGPITGGPGHLDDATFPLDLGAGISHPLGVEISDLAGPHALG